MHINLTKLALKSLKKVLAKNKTNQEVYIYLADIGCGGGGKATFSLTTVNQKDEENLS